MHRVATFIIVLAALGLSIASAAQPKDLVKAELLADVDAIKPGQPFNVGVRMTIKPGWHTYWKYPGDSGAATKIEFKAPAGFKLGELRFPIPKQFNQPGDIIGYGYENEVMLLAEITPPAELKSDQPIEIVANAKWLVCENVCIPGKKELKISLPVSEGAKRANDEAFKTWSRRLPSAARRSASLVRRKDGSAFTATVTSDQELKDAQWFPVPPDGAGIENAQTKTSASESSFSFDLVPAPRNADPMQFLVAYTDPQGKREGVEFTVNLPQPSAQP